MSRFLFVGRMEKKKLESARQDKFETMTDVVQRTPLNIILEFQKFLKSETTNDILQITPIKIILELWKLETITDKNIDYFKWVLPVWGEPVRP